MFGLPYWPFQRPLTMVECHPREEMNCRLCDGGTEEAHAEASLK